MPLPWGAQTKCSVKFFSGTLNSLFQWFSTKGDFASQEMLGNVWRHFCCYSWKGSCSWHQAGRGQGASVYHSTMHSAAATAVSHPAPRRQGQGGETKLRLHLRLLSCVHRDCVNLFGSPSPALPSHPVCYGPKSCLSCLAYNIYGLLWIRFVC